MLQITKVKIRKSIGIPISSEICSAITSLYFATALYFMCCLLLFENGSIMTAVQELILETPKQNNNYVLFTNDFYQREI